MSGFRVYDLSGGAVPAFPTATVRATPDTPEYEQTVQALSYVESRHDPCAVSPSGSFVGRWQMGDAAASDVGLPSADVLRCNGDLARWALDAYLAKYARWHHWDPLLIALTWKSGPGTAREVRELLDGDASLTVRSALSLADRPDSTRGELPYRTQSYLALFESALSDVERGSDSHPRSAAVVDGVYVL